MHWCPDCGEPCFCDSEDYDWGVQYCNKHECRNTDDYDLVHYDELGEDEAIEKIMRKAGCERQMAEYLLGKVNGCKLK